MRESEVARAKSVYFPPDAARFTQLLTPRDLSQALPGQCKYVTLCAPDGGIVNDPILLKLSEDRFWLSLADSDALLYALGVQAFANMDVQIHEPDVSPLQIQGPLSKPLIRKLFGDEVADQRYYWHKQTNLDGIPVVVSRTGWSAELGYEVYLRDSRFAADLFKDRIVMVGASFIGIADSYPAPFGSTPIPGTERLANIVDTILAGDFIRETTTNPRARFSPDYFYVQYSFRW